MVLHPDQVNFGELKIADEAWDCDAEVQVRDLVFASAGDHVGRADASDESKMPGTGFVVSKPTETTCFVRSVGTLGGFVGLEAGETYSADPTVPGGIMKDGPVGDSGKVLRRVGFAKNSTTLVIIIDRDYTVL